jgi:hypothetical protein
MSSIENQSKRLYSSKLSHPKKILPKKYRDDPFAEPPPITGEDISEGMISLLNRGIIPRDVDLTPAFERGAPPFTLRKVKLYNKREKLLRK